MRDIRQAIRSLSRTPWFTLAVVATLAVAVGANTLIFSVVNGVVLDPLPFRDADRLVAVANENSPDLSTVSPPDLHDWRSDVRGLDGLAAYTIEPVNLTGGREPARLQAARVTANWFSLLGIGAAAGRTFTADEDQPAAPRVAILSHQTWLTRFGGESSVVGRTVMLDGNPYLVIGVAPPRFVYPETPDLWVPLVFTPRELANDNRGAHYLTTIGRLATGFTFATTRSALETVSARLRVLYPRHEADFRYTLRPLRDAVVGDTRGALLILLGAVGCVLLIACANVANLLLVRATARAEELALRMVLGARRWLLIRRLLLESALLTAAGGVIGALLAWWGISVVATARPARLPRLEEVSLEPRVLLFTLALVAATTLLVGLAPALQASRPDVVQQIKSGSRALASGGRIRRALVVAEMALAVVLLVGAGLLTQSFARLLAVDPGFRAEHVAKLEVSLPAQSYATWGRLRGFTHDVVRRLASLPGVTGAAAGYGIPFTGGESSTLIRIVGRPPANVDVRNFVDVQIVTPRYFATLGIPLHRGRVFTDADRAGGHQVAIVNERFVQQYFPGEDPVGKTLTSGWRTDSAGQQDGSDTVRLGGEIVGVVGDTKKADLQTLEGPTIYVPFDQSSIGYLAFVVRSTADPSSIITAAKRAVADVDPNVPTYGELTLASAIRSTAAQSRLYAELVSAFAVVALLLAVIGISGVVAYSVRERRRELGIRVALGARADQVVGLVVRQSMSSAALGLAAGLVVASLGGRVLDRLLYGIHTDDPPTYGAIGLGLLIIAALASWLPARRAATVDPVIAMRPE